jgi:hypothetical protein
MIRILAVLLFTCVACVAWAADPDIGLELTLVNGLHHGTPGPQTPNLMMDLDRRGGQWDRAWANARNFNVSIHWGRVNSAQIASDSIALDLVMRIEGDSWVQGGRAYYQVALKRAADGTLEGTFQGKFKGKDYTGRAFGRVKPPVAVRAGFVPVEPGEHPRLIFRKSDIPRLRALAQTPFGKAALAALPRPIVQEGGKPIIDDKTGEAKSLDAIGMGVKYHLTGEAQWAERCREAVAWHMNDVGVPAFARGRQWGPRIEQVAVGFDLCCDAWPTEFRKQVASYLRYTCTTMFNDPQKFGRGINWTVGSNYAGPIFAGVAFSGLALVGEPGPEPTRPQPPSGVDEIAPVEFQPQAGVPVVPLPVGAAARQWLTASVGFGMSNDPMEGIAEWADLRIAPGTEIEIDETKAVFGALDEKHIMPVDEKNPKRGGINLRSGHIAPGKTFTLLGYNVIKVDTAGQYKLRAPSSKSGRVQVVLAGSHIASDQVIGLKPGLYPFLICMRLPAGLWGSLEPWFEPATADDLAKSAQKLEAAKADYEEKVKDWEFDLARWQQNGNRDVQFEKLNEMGRRMMYLFAREASGDGGYQTESGHYYEDAIDGPARYAHAYWNVYGRRLSSFNDLTAFVPRTLMAKILRPDAGKDLDDGFIRQQISSGWGEGSVLRTLAEMYPQLDEAYKPALLWHWNRCLGGDPERPDVTKLLRFAPAYAVVNYPINAEGTAPTVAAKHPRTVMPLTWAADGFGHYTFRNGWAGPESDIVVQVFGKARPSHGWGGADGSTFAIWGVGSSWANTSSDREVRRFMNSVVILPEDKLTEGALGRVAHRALKPDGSGTVTFDVTQQFFEPTERGATVVGPKGEVYGAYFHPGQKEPIAKDPIRAFAVDYSKASGAPMLFSVLDRIDGGKKKVWHWQMGTDRVETSAKGFTIKGANGWTMQVTFIAPQEVVVSADKEDVQITKTAGHGGGKTKIAKVLNAVRVSGKDPNDGRIWAVATLAQGAHPEVKTTGSGLEATVTVGGQTLTFDGTKLVLAK